MGHNLLPESLKLFVSRVGGVSCNPSCLPPNPGVMQFLKRRNIATNHPLCRANDTLQPALVLDGGSSVPDGDGGERNCQVLIHSCRPSSGNQEKSCSALEADVRLFCSSACGSLGSWCLSPAVYGREAGYTLDRSPVHHRREREKGVKSFHASVDNSEKNSPFSFFMASLAESMLFYFISPSKMSSGPEKRVVFLGIVVTFHVFPTLPIKPFYPPTPSNSSLESIFCHASLNKALEQGYASLLVEGILLISSFWRNCFHRSLDSISGKALCGIWEHKVQERQNRLSGRRDSACSDCLTPHGPPSLSGSPLLR
ncbi:hypothetical protein ILYODFUR_004520 [Ilyodon furcidens]|uniref:Uncharacterized protein n=1 Tax=Ilyodon furcidens TaxID=33524 RepID=A0ABV0US24_9TELE